MHTDEKAASAGTDSGSKGIAGTRYCPPDQADTQRAIILAYLSRVGTLSTLEARAILYVMSPASRIFELRGMGYSITTTRDPRQKCARYQLVGGDHAEQ